MAFDKRAQGAQPSQFNPSPSIATQERSRAVLEHQSGCGARLYPNTEDSRPVKDLFWEITSCTVDRSIGDIGGGFSMMLLPTNPWDELILPDDYMRIFMGDQIRRKNTTIGSTNFASGDLRTNLAFELSNKGNVFVPIPGSEKISGGKVSYTESGKKNISYLTMFERAVVKVDRVEAITAPPSGPNAGTTVAYSVTGRMFGSILQDMSLYYNEFLPGLNAINVFFGSTVPLQGSPSDLVKGFLEVVLSSVPFPQWKIPESLANDLNFSHDDNKEIIKRNIKRMKDALNSDSTKKITDSNTLTELRRLLIVNESDEKRSPLSILSLSGIKQTFGTYFTKNFMQSVTVGVYDTIKHLSNPAWNEFWVDLCPNGNPDGGLSTNERMALTVVFRQHPYDITNDMLLNTSNHLKVWNRPFEKFPREFKGGISSSLFDKMNNAVTIFGPMAEGKINIRARNLKSFAPNDLSVPTTYEIQTGYSNHARLNSFIVLGSYTRSQFNQFDRIIVTKKGGFFVDHESIQKFGMRMLDTSTFYAEPNSKAKDKKSNEYPLILKSFGAMLANWNFMNPGLLNGRINCRFLPDARLGIPYKYFETRITPTNPRPKLEIGYIQGVQDVYEFNQPLLTNLTTIRGIRYDLSEETAVIEEINRLGELDQRAHGDFPSLGRNFA